MCGIAGIVTRDGSRSDEGQLVRMGERIRHRGPDGSRHWLAEGVGLAHQRLAIIDVSQTGNQPMHDSTGRYTIVFNGEIYNYQELRDSLEVDWKSTSDTEVILEGYRAWGEDVVKKLRGMFALAIWDQYEQQLFLARDRIGKKPLFYTRTKTGNFIFASEIKAFRDLVDLQPDWHDVRTFLGLQYVPTPKTGLQNILQLEAGYVATVKKGVLTKRSYHNWSRKVQAMSEPDTDQMIRKGLDEAVKVRMLAADVPVGAFLSGGVDSAAIVAMATKYSRGPFHTFTMGFSNARMDERAQARALAHYFKTEHHDFEARPQDLLAVADELIGQYDVPYADSSALPLWLLARETSKHIKVVLTGDGGDELFGGYRRYQAFQRALWLQSKGLSGLASDGARFVWLMSHDPRWQRFAETLDGLHQSVACGYANAFTGSYFSHEHLKPLLKKDFMKETVDADASMYIQHTFADAGSVTPLQDAIYFDLTSYLPDDLNVKMDRATMRFGLEARAPFLDQELVQCALGIPDAQKIRGHQTKVALKRSLQGIVPEDALTRPKRGFQVPLAEWFRGELRESINDRCLNPVGPLADIVQLEEVKHLMNENDRGADHGNRLWMLFALSTWLTQLKNPIK